MQASYCSCCQLTLVTPVNFCPRCGADQRLSAYRAVAAPAAVGLPPISRADTLVYLILGWVFAALALSTVSPLVFGPAAIVMGAIAWSHGSRQGMAIVFVGIGATIGGFLLSYAIHALTSSDVTSAAEEAAAPITI